MLRIWKYIFIVIDLIVVSGSALVFIVLKSGTKEHYLPFYIYPTIAFVTTWFVFSLVFSKYNFKEYVKPKKILVSIVLCNFSIAGFLAFLIYVGKLGDFSRMIVLGSFVGATLLELILAYLMSIFQNANSEKFVEQTDIPESVRITWDEVEKHQNQSYPEFPTPEKSLTLPIIEIVGENAFTYIASFVDIGSTKTCTLATSTTFNVKSLPFSTYASILNLKRVNDVRRINKFFEEINVKLPVGGHFVCCAETNSIRKRKILNNRPGIISYPIYFLDFIFKRVFPKVWGLKKIYFMITAGKGRAISKAEFLGRLISCGFSIVDTKRYNNLLFAVTMKVADPAYDLNPTYGPLIKMSRMGKNGKVIKVYKIRTMHPYSEYLQKYIYEKNDLQEGGKFKDDFRITTQGKIMRKLWIDELPMLINLMRGDLKLFGVRPLSKHYLSLYPESFQKKRSGFKPGLVPPFYVDNPKTLDEIIASEEKYLADYSKKPFITDVKYLFKALYNIFFKRYRSA